MYNALDPPPELTGDERADLIRLHEYLTELFDTLEYYINKPKK